MRRGRRAVAACVGPAVGGQAGGGEGRRGGSQDARCGLLTRCTTNGRCCALLLHTARAGCMLAGVDFGELKMLPSLQSLPVWAALRRSGVGSGSARAGERATSSIRLSLKIEVLSDAMTHAKIAGMAAGLSPRLESRALPAASPGRSASRKGCIQVGHRVNSVERAAQWCASGQWGASASRASDTAAGSAVINLCSCLVSLSNKLQIYQQQQQRPRFSSTGGGGSGGGSTGRAAATAAVAAPSPQSQPTHDSISAAPAAAPPAAPARPPRVTAFVGLRGDSFRHPLDRQATSLLRVLPGLELLARRFISPAAEQVG